MSRLNRIGRYQVDEVWREEPLGRILWARLPEFDRAVLIRELVPAPHMPTEDRERLREAFREECRLLGRIQHPRFQRAEDMGEAESGSVFLVYERPDPAVFHALADVAHSLAAEAAVRVAGELARALAFLRAAGCSAGVFTPADAWISRKGELRVLHLSFSSLGLRFGSALPGGVPHLAPELLKGAPPSERTLVYSLAAWLYGQLAPAAAPPEEAAVHGREPDPLWTLNPSVRAAVDEVLQQALARDPERRLATLEELARRLQPPVTGPSVAPAVETAPAPARKPVEPQPEATEGEVPDLVRYAGWAAGLAVAGGLTGYVLAHLFPPR